MKNIPKARYENIVVQELEAETLICDLATNHVFCLNRTIGEVWKLCDGENGVSQIAEILTKKLRTNFSNELVLLSLNTLKNENLITKDFSSENYLGNISRREMVRRVGLASMIALPIITSVAMPHAVNAQSGPQGLNGPCATTSNCQAGLACSGGICLRTNGQFCASAGECAVGFCVDSVCCNTSCSSACEKCNLSGRVGFCDPVPAGQDPDNECPSGGGLLGFCNGARACV